MTVIDLEKLLEFEPFLSLAFSRKLSFLSVLLIKIGAMNVYTIII